MRHQQGRIALGMAIVLSGVVACGAGCGKDGPPLGAVKGLVTLDGQPLEGAVVEFRSVAAEQLSFEGQTDKAGRYQLHASASRKGAEPGDYTVHISLPRTGTDPARKPQPKLPAKYNEQTELKATVKPRSNTLDFKLESR
jgi:hypothetical protein